MGKLISAKDIRPINRQYDGIKNRFIMEWLISCRLSPFFSAYFVNKKVSPNQVTLLMIGCGLLGAVFFALPNISCKIVGAVFIQLWFVMDCSDGEVARYTKQYSTFGREMDFMAHIITHPFFIISFCLSFIQLYSIDPFKIVLAFSVFIISEFWARSIVFFNAEMVKSKKENAVSVQGKKKGYVREILSYIVGNLWAFPNYVLIFPFFYGLDALCQTSYFLHLTALYACFCFLYNFKELVRCLIRLYRN